MNDYGENPRLKEHLRSAYRSSAASPYLAQRVVAGVKVKDRPSIPWLKLASGLACLFVAVIVVNSTRDSRIPDPPGIARFSPKSIEIPGFSQAGVLYADINVPGLSTVVVPAMNQLNTPDSSQYNPGDICIYPKKGEKSC